MYVHTRERDSRPGFDGVKIKLLLLSFHIWPNHFNLLLVNFFLTLSFTYICILSSSILPSPGGILKGGPQDRAENPRNKLKC